MPVVLLDLSPLSQRPLRQPWHDAVDLKERVCASVGVAVRTGGDAIGSALAVEAGEANLLVVGWAYR